MHANYIAHLTQTLTPFTRTPYSCIIRKFLDIPNIPSHVNVQIQNKVIFWLGKIQNKTPGICLF